MGSRGRPLTSETPKPRAAIFLPKQPAPTASAEDLLRHLDDGALLVLDARAAERYRETWSRSIPSADIPGSAQPSVYGKSRAARHLQAGGAPAPGIRGGARRPVAFSGGPSVRLGRHRLPQRARDGRRWIAGIAALSGLVERVDRRSGAAGGDRRRSSAAKELRAGPARRPWCVLPSAALPPAGGPPRARAPRRRFIPLIAGFVASFLSR
mgnify:CR=1 FL=1